ncbi:MAG: hypothetical protein ACLSWI_06415 [Candidatus Gastranaerophilaceae bacterium]
MRVSPIASSYFSVQKNDIDKNKKSFVYQTSLNENNASGLIQKKYAIPFMGSVMPIKYIVENGNKRIIKEFLNNGTLQRIIRKVEETLSGDFLSEARFVYKDNNSTRLLKTINVDKSGNKLWETRYKYDDIGRILETSDFNSDGKLLHRTEYFPYRAQKETIDYAPNGEQLNRVTYLNEDGRHIKKKDILDKNSKDYGKTQVFDENNNLIGYEICDYNGYIKTIRENGTLAELRKENYGYSGRGSYISSINITKYAEDGVTETGHIFRKPQTSQIEGSAEEYMEYNFRDKSKMLKDIKVSYEFQIKYFCYSVQFDEKGEISKIIKHSRIGGIYNKEVYKKGDPVKNLEYNAKTLYEGLQNINKNLDVDKLYYQIDNIRKNLV